MLVALLAGCGGRKPTPPIARAPTPAVVYHHVGRGETLGRIARAYAIDYRLIAQANSLRDPSRIATGQWLLIPGATHAVLVPPDDGLALAPLDRAAVTAHPTDAPRLRWPIVAGTVTSLFGTRNGTHHDGIDISAPSGAPVRAAADGEVAYSGALPGYGNMIIVRHARGYVTVYAHNDQHHAAEGARVRGGQLIATVGRSGRATGPNLHFEVRKDNVAYDPLQFLPALAAGGAGHVPINAREAGGSAGEGG
jgi:murein DD-endopeptidase MepM/ murein hydrolase activator NlpD